MWVWLLPGSLFLLALGAGILVIDRFAQAMPSKTVTIRAVGGILCLLATWGTGFLILREPRVYPMPGYAKTIRLVEVVMIDAALTCLVWLGCRMARRSTIGQAEPSVPGDQQ